MKRQVAIISMYENLTHVSECVIPQFDMHEKWGSVMIWKCVLLQFDPPRLCKMICIEMRENARLYDLRADEFEMTNQINVFPLLYSFE